MSTQTQAVARSPKREIRALLQSDTVKQQIALALPKFLSPDRMMRVALTAVNKNPKLLGCTPESLLGGLMLCSQVGLEPDGRNAHLIPYGDQCQVIFDWKGLVALARRNGVQVTPEVVCDNDTFIVKKDDGNGRSSVTHIIDYRKPRGEIYAAYSRAKIGDEVDYEIMTKDEIECVRNTFSRGKDADAWRKSWGEMAKKTVIRRHSKRWPLDPEVAEVFQDDGEGQPQKMATTKPIFGAAPQLPDVPLDEAPAAPDDGEETASAQPPADDGKADELAARHVKGVKGLLKLANQSEVNLIAFLQAKHGLDDSVGTLAEMGKVARQTLAKVHDEWSKISAELKQWQEEAQ